jgi:hypothetical protein
VVAAAPRTHDSPFHRWHRNQRSATHATTSHQTPLNKPLVRPTSDVGAPAPNGASDRLRTVGIVVRGDLPFFPVPNQWKSPSHPHRKLIPAAWCLASRSRSLPEGADSGVLPIFDEGLSTVRFGSVSTPTNQSVRGDVPAFTSSDGPNGTCSDRTEPEQRRGKEPSAGTGT